MGLSVEEAQAVLEERQRGGPFASYAEMRKRVELMPDALAALVRAGAFDFAGVGRQVLLRSEGLTNRGRLPPAWRRDGVAPWPWQAILGRHPLAAIWQEEWGLLGLVTGPPLMQLARPMLPAGLACRRELKDGQRARVAGLVARGEDGEEDGPARLTLLDELGAFEAVLAEGELPEDGSPVVLEGVAEVKFGAFTFRADTASAPLAPSVIATIGGERLAS